MVWLQTARVQGWFWQDYLLWPLDNFVRAYDFVDVMQIYNLRFYAVPPGLWVSTLTLLCRLLFMLLFLRQAAKVRAAIYKFVAARIDRAEGLLE